MHKWAQRGRLGVCRRRRGARVVARRKPGGAQRSQRWLEKLGTSGNRRKNFTLEIKVIYTTTDILQF